jgi:hypothetical protein
MQDTEKSFSIPFQKMQEKIFTKGYSPKIYYMHNNTEQHGEFIIFLIYTQKLDTAEFQPATCKI